MHVRARLGDTAAGSGAHLQRVPHAQGGVPEAGAPAASHTDDYPYFPAEHDVDLPGNDPDERNNNYLCIGAAFDDVADTDPLAPTSSSTRRRASA